MRPSSCLFLALVVVASAQEQVVTTARSLTACQTCCSPGGSCSSKEKGELKCCGDVIGASYCCPFHAKCYACARSYRCYDSSRPSSAICAHEGGSAGGGFDHRGSEAVSSIITLIFFIVIGTSIYSCIKLQRRERLLHQQMQQGIAMPAVALPPQGVPVAGRPLAHPTAGMPVTTAYPAGGCYPAHPGYGGGYSGGSVAMGAGMGFLGGMMMSDALSDAGHHGGYGGDYGGGGGGDFGGGGDAGFAADM